MSAADAAASLRTDIESGLSVGDAEQRLKEYGRNAIEAAARAPWLGVLLRQFTSPLILVLIAATVVMMVLEHYRDAVFITVAVLVNAALGFYQENKAERALSELKSYLKQRARVIRDGREHDIDAEELVPGDVMRLSQGDRVPADARLIFINDLQVDEAVLTGESLPDVKSIEPAPESAGLGDQGSMVFAGTLVTQGIGTAVVCRTGAHTEFGKIAELIAASETDGTPLQKSIRQFSVRASLFLGALTALVFVGGILAGYSTLSMFLTSVAIAVSAIPEGLPVALTVILSVGVQRMAKRKGVVRKLVAAEALGSTTVILTDKTGTLTVARMEMTSVVSLGRLSEEELLRRGLVNTSVLIENPEEKPAQWIMSGKIMEVALVRGAALRGIPVSDPAHTVLQAVPFNAVQKYSVSLVEEEGEQRLVYFGAPDILIAHASLHDDERQALLSRIDELASTGSRVLGIAHKKVEPSPDFSLAKEHDISRIIIDGLLVFHDPVRPGVKDAIDRIARAGIRTVILTGDHGGTAQAIAREVGLHLAEGSHLDAAEIAGFSDEELAKRLRHVQVISRVTPFDKLRIAKLYQAAGEVIAMTGDGVNDAPSIKQADVGIAMGSGTEVSRSVADLVLLDDNFETIVAAVEEGRQIMANIRKVLVYLLSNVADGLILIGGALVTGLPLPLNPLQILWVNFFTDSFPAIAYAFEKEPHALKHKPRKPGQGLFDPLMRFLILIIGLTTSAMLFVLYWVLLRAGFDEQLVRTFVFALFGTHTLFVALSVRSLGSGIFSYSIFSNLYLLAGILVGLVLMMIAVYVPLFQSLFDTVALPPIWIATVFALGVANIAIIELGKWLFRRRSQ